MTTLLHELQIYVNCNLPPRQENSDSIQEQYELLSEQLHRLKIDKILETDTLSRFKLEKQIEKVEAELSKLER